MTRQSVQGTLTGRRVLVVHEDAFFGAYLGDVIAASGANVAGLASLAAEGRAVLDHDPPPCLLVLSSMVRDADTVARTAAARGVATLSVQPACGALPQAVPGQAALIAPFAGFQVVDALRQLLSATPAIPASSGHSTVPGH